MSAARTTRSSTGSNPRDGLSETDGRETDGRGPERAFSVGSPVVRDSPGTGRRLVAEPPVRRSRRCRGFRLCGRADRAPFVTGGIVATPYGPLMADVVRTGAGRTGRRPARDPPVADVDDR